MSKKIEGKKKVLREKLRLPVNYDEKMEAAKRSRSPEKETSFEIISSDDDSMSEEDYCPQPKRRSRWESRDYNKSRHYESPRRNSPPVLDDNEPVTLITVCRLLSALENELGTLSSNVLDLLSKALALEKCKANSSDELLMTAENSVFLETVKEKMKGLLMVNALPPQKIAAVKKCIQNIAKLIHQTPVNDVKEEKVVEGDNEKRKLAEEIAATLKAHGKENCTPEELEVLVEMFLEPQKEEEEKETSNFEALSDNDLKILLGNFTELEADEQNHVIKFLSELEKREPERVDALRKFVKVDDDNDDQQPIKIDDDDDYNFSEIVHSVVANVGAASSLTDNLLTIGKNHSKLKFC